jgi:hypothetical protein
MRFVPTKDGDRQDLQALHRARERLMGARTALVNAVHGLIERVAQFIGVCSSVDTCSNEEGRGKGRGENAYKTMAEEPRAFQSLCEATDTVNGRQRAQCTVFRGLYDHVKGLSYIGLRAR